MEKDTKMNQTTNTAKWDLLFTVAEVSKLLKVNVNTVYDLINTGHLKALKLGRYKIPKYELIRFVKENMGMDLTDLDNVKPLDH